MTSESLCTSPNWTPSRIKKMIAAMMMVMMTTMTEAKATNGEDEGKVAMPPRANKAMKGDLLSRSGPFTTTTDVS